MNSKLLSWIKFLIGWPLSIVSIIFIVKLIFEKSNEITINPNEINFFYLILGVLFFLIYYLLKSFLWQTELKEKGYKINFKGTAYGFSFSQLKRYTPGNVWSFLSLAERFSRLGVDKKTIGIAILGDIQLVIIGAGFVSLFSIPWLLDSTNELQTKLGGIIPISILGIAIFFIATGFVYSKSMLLHSSILLTNFLLPGFELKSKIKLSIFAIFTYFIFGVGNYFAFLSIFPSSFDSFLVLSSFFVFSLLVGYLSFITPMGIGVREGVVTLGFSKITSLGSAGVIAIYTRIVLIISELLFLALVFLWKKLPKS